MAQAKGVLPTRDEDREVLYRALRLGVQWGPEPDVFRDPRANMLRLSCNSPLVAGLPETT